MINENGKFSRLPCLSLAETMRMHTKSADATECIVLRTYTRLHGAVTPFSREKKWRWNSYSGRDSSAIDKQYFISILKTLHKLQIYHAQEIEHFSLSLLRPRFAGLVHLFFGHQFFVWTQSWEISNFSFYSLFSYAIYWSILCFVLFLSLSLHFPFCQFYLFLSYFVWLMSFLSCECECTFVCRCHDLNLAFKAHVHLGS